MKKAISYISMILVLGLTVGCGSNSVVSNDDRPQEEGISKQIAEKEKAEDKKEEADNEKDPALSLNGLEMKGSIKISTYDDDDFIAEAAKAFEERYPDVHINVDIFAPSDIEVSADGQAVLSSANDDPNLSMEKYVTQLNTAFMNGTASDMINLKGLPYYKYAEKGFLYDLGNTIDGEDGLKPDEYYMNVSNAMQYDEGYYNMPFTYNVKCVGVLKPYLVQAGMKEADLQNEMWDLDSMVQTAKKVQEKTGKQYTLSRRDNGIRIFLEQLRISEKPFIDVKEKKVSFDSEAFIQRLEEIKALADEGYVNEEADKCLFTSNYELGQPYCKDDYYTPAWEDYGVAWKPYCSDKGNAMISYCNYGINTSSKQKELCWAFMKFLYSEEVQSQNYCTGLCVNKAAEKKQIERTVDFYEKDDHYKLNASREEIVADYARLYDQCITGVKSCQLIDDSVRDTIFDEVGLYFKGEKTAEEVAKTLQNKINVMFNE